MSWCSVLPACILSNSLATTSTPQGICNVSQQSSLLDIISHGGIWDIEPILSIGYESNYNSQFIYEVKCSLIVAYIFEKL